MRDRESDTRLKVLIATALAVFIVAVIWLTTDGGERPEPSSRESQEANDTRRPTVTDESAARVDPVDERGKSSPDEPAHMEHAAVETHRDDATAVTIRFVDDEGEPLEGFAFEWQAFDSQGLRGLSRGADSGLPDSWHAANADDNGRAIIACDVHLIVRSRNESWGHTGGGLLPPYLRGLDRRRYDYIRARGGTHIESRWAPHVEVDVWVRYEDGMPFSERVDWLPLDSNKKGQVSPQWNSKETCPQPLNLRGPKGTWCRVTVSSTRKGYQHQASTEVEFLGGPQRGVDLIIPVSKSPEPSYIEVDCTALPSDADLEALKVSICNERGRAVGTNPVPPSHIVRFGPFFRPGNKLCAHLSGNYTWRSELFSVDPGETRRLVAVPQPGGDVKARVMNQDGQPICPAVLFLAKPQHRHTWVAPRWGRGQSFDGIRAHANDEGELHLKDAPPGTWPMRVEAQGYEPLEIEVVVTSEVERDLGDLHLERAQCSITVVLKVDDDDKREFVYELMYAVYGSYTGGFSPFADQHKTTIPMVSKGEYYLYVADKPEHISEGYSGWGKIVKVDGGNVTVEVDTTLPKGNQ